MIATFLSGFTSIGLVIGALALAACIELLIPLHPRHRWNRLHLTPNLTLTLLTFATNLVFNTALVLALGWLEARGVGLLPWLGASSIAMVIAVVVGLDFAAYAAHRAMHRMPMLWRFHLVHHSDPAVDVTTTIRQHPGESVWRYSVMAAAACALGASPGAFAVYRLWSVFNGLAEHANVRMPRRLDGLLSWVLTTPNLHKVHHSRSQGYTDTNYGNIFSVFDRAFKTFTPSSRGETIEYGLDGFDHPAAQTTRALLAAPFRVARSSS